jgi:hypothetical protein
MPALASLRSCPSRRVRARRRSIAGIDAGIIA